MKTIRGFILFALLSTPLTSSAQAVWDTPEFFSTVYSTLFPSLITELTSGTGYRNTDLDETQKRELLAVREEAVDFLAVGQTGETLSRVLNKMRDDYPEQNLTDEQAASLIVAMTADL